MIPEIDALQIISQHREDSIVVLSYLGKDWPETPSHPPEVSFVGCMGKAAPFGLGLALAKPAEKVIVLEGDGSLLMNLGTLVTIANAAPRNLICILFENSIYQTTGGHPIPSERNISFTGLAEAAGFPEVYEFDQAEELQDHIEEILLLPGPTFINLKVSRDGKRRPITLLKHDYAQFKESMDKLR
jgi:sulfopyruvate decarboxylase subunit beta